MRLAFLGTPEAAVPSLRALVDAGHDVAVVITRPDRKRGRGAHLSPSPVKACALELGLSIGHRLSDLEERDIERGVVVAYGRIIPADVLAQTPMVNVHFSLLPRWRGAAPVERAILAGDAETGVSIMTLDEDLDTGPVHLQERVEVDDKSLATLLGELATLGAGALTKVLGSAELLAHARPQQGEATYAEKLTKEDFRLSTTATTEQLLRVIRLGQAYTMVRDRRILVESASAYAGEVAPGSIALRDGQVVLGSIKGAIALERVRPASSKSMSATAWWTGARFGDDPLRWT